MVNIKAAGRPGNGTACFLVLSNHEDRGVKESQRLAEKVEYHSVARRRDLRQYRSVVRIYDSGNDLSRDHFMSGRTEILEDSPLAGHRRIADEPKNQSFL